MTFSDFLSTKQEVQKSDSVTKSLGRFTAAETLDDSNKWFCPSCSGLQKCKKRMSVARAPNCLTLMVKRYSNTFDKNNSHISFDASLDLSSYSSEAHDSDKVDASYMYSL